MKVWITKNWNWLNDLLFCLIGLNTTSNKSKLFTVKAVRDLICKLDLNTHIVLPLSLNRSTLITSESVVRSHHGLYGRFPKQLAYSHLWKLLKWLFKDRNISQQVCWTSKSTYGAARMHVRRYDDSQSTFCNLTLPVMFHYLTCPMFRMNLRLYFINWLADLCAWEKL